MAAALALELSRESRQGEDGPSPTWGRVARLLGKRVRGSRAWWDVVNYLHVWGFHGAKLDVDAVKSRWATLRASSKPWRGC